MYSDFAICLNRLDIILICVEQINNVLCGELGG